jgi:hypothetical protein
VLLILQWRPATIHLGNNILTILQWLGKVADGTNYVFVTVDTEWDDRNEAERKPGITFNNPCRPIALLESVYESSTDDG